MTAKPFWVSTTAALFAACASHAPSSGESAAAATVVVQGSGDAWGPNISLRDAITPGNPSAQPPSGGWYVTGIHATLLPSGSVLLDGWGRTQVDSCNFAHGGARSIGESFVVDPSALDQLGGTTLDITPIGEAGEQLPDWSPDVIYCSGATPMADGRVFFAGGARYESLGGRDGAAETEIGVGYARLFDPSSSTFAAVAAPMTGGPANSPIRQDGQPVNNPTLSTPPGAAGNPSVDKRGWHWYPTSTRMPDGTVVVGGGFTGGPNGGNSEANVSMEQFVPATGTFNLLVQHDGAPALANFMTPGTKDYTHTLLLPNGQLAMMGWAGQLLFFDPVQASFVLAPNNMRPQTAGGSGAAAAWDSTSALASTGEILVMGGTNDKVISSRADLYSPQTGQWRSIDTGIGRRNGASILLPDGTVLLINGYDEDVTNLPGDRKSPQVLDPSAGVVTTFSPWPDDPNERGYHSFALLLKDARILIGGGIYGAASAPNPVTSIGCERTDLRIYTPAYLTKGPRPSIDTTEPIAAAPGGGLHVAFSGAPLDPQKGVVLMALGAFTHGFDQNQRYVGLTFTTSSDGTSLDAVIPSDTRVAPPGDYMLYLVSTEGVPSVGQLVQLGAPGATVPPAGEDAAAPSATEDASGPGDDEDGDASTNDASFVDDAAPGDDASLGP